MDIDQWIEQGKAMLLQAWQKLVDTTLWFAKETEKADLAFDPGVTFLLALIIVVLLGSACWAAAIAQARRHSPWLHFCCGLLLPWLYPLVILFAMGIKGEKEMRERFEAEKKAREEREAERQRNMAMGTPEKEEELEEDDSGWNRKYFEKISRNHDGRPVGPWKVRFQGATLQVVRIIEVQDELVMVEHQDDKGQSSRLRLPYARIENWQDATQG